MSNILRDTQFAGFAKALWDELPDGINLDATFDGYDAWSTTCERIIAQRVYDLVDHTVCWIDPLDYMSQENPCEAILKSIPDLTEFPPKNG